MMTTYLLVKKVKSVPQIMQLTTELSSTQKHINCRFSAGDLKLGPEGPWREELSEVVREMLDPRVGVGGDDHTLDSLIIFITIIIIITTTIINIMPSTSSSPSSTSWNGRHHISRWCLWWRYLATFSSSSCSHIAIVVADSFLHVLNSLHPIIFYEAVQHSRKITVLVISLTRYSGITIDSNFMDTVVGPLAHLHNTI